MGAPTVFERDVVVGFGPMVAPDRIVVGFSPTMWIRRKNTPPKNTVGLKSGTVAGWGASKNPRRGGLAAFGRAISKALNRWAELSGRVPDYEEQLRRAYAEDAPTWIAFREALVGTSKSFPTAGAYRPLSSPRC
ncbi:MAG: hypothetical protein IPQ26_09585 [Elusimicrobia bacterium]|nr:hypothetical protein [Elusimicrobiota bacterium]